LYTNRERSQRNWITKGIKISCTHKRELFIRYGENKDNIHLKNHYRKYCQIPKNVVNEAKKQFFIKQIADSSNKLKTVWKIIKDSTGNPHHDDRINKIKSVNGIIKNPIEIANAFNEYFISYLLTYSMEQSPS
jgi:hypothetical protein